MLPLLLVVSYHFHACSITHVHIPSLNAAPPNSFPYKTGYIITKLFGFVNLLLEDLPFAEVSFCCCWLFDYRLVSARHSMW